MAQERRRFAPGHRNKQALAAGAFLVILLCLAVVVVKSDLDPDAKALITLIIGRFLGYVDNIYSFEFATTRDSGKPPGTPTDAAAVSPSDPSAKEVVR